MSVGWVTAVLYLIQLPSPQHKVQLTALMLQMEELRLRKEEIPARAHAARKESQLGRGGHGSKGYYSA